MPHKQGDVGSVERKKDVCVEVTNETTANSVINLPSIKCNRPVIYNWLVMLEMNVFSRYLVRKKHLFKITFYGCEVLSSVREA